ncbi:MAG: DUF4145 domain-containing protein [bacterium]|nr:DUF4145 domain-containing protein [bacterium]
MEDRKKLLQTLTEEGATQAEQGVALLWFYKIKQVYDERTAIELAQDLFDDGFSKPNISRFIHTLRKDRRTIRGGGKDSLRINPRFFRALTEKYSPIVSYVPTSSSSSVIPLDLVSVTKIHFQQMAKQINGCYDGGFYDASAVILRRLLETLIIEIYIEKKQAPKIKNDTTFKSLDKLLTIITNDPDINLSRGAPKSMQLIKDIGDNAAHSRSYITPQEDIDDNKLKIRRIISELIQMLK